MARFRDLTLKHDRAGQPLKYTPEELQEEFFDFINECQSKREMPTIAGFKSHLEITNRTFSNYQKRPEFELFFDILINSLEHITINCKYKHITDIIKKASLQKHHNYADKKESDTKNENVNKNIDIDYSHLSESQIERISNTDSLEEIDKILKENS